MPHDSRATPADRSSSSGLSYSTVGLGTAAGVGIGSLIGAAIGDMPVGVGSGIGVGLALALGLDHLRRRRPR